jgi:hypothetical protein
VPEVREVEWQGRKFMVDDHGVVQHGVDMARYDAEMEEAGFEFVDGDEDETEITFVVDPESGA